MKDILLSQYNKLIHICGMSSNEIQPANSNMMYIIKKSLRDFMHKYENTAIWCWGNHTEMLMADFVFELKNVKYIIDAKPVEKAGYEIVKPEMIRQMNIDGVIISSFQYRNEIKERIKREFPDIKYLDVYDALKEKGIELTTEYYRQNHPYERYRKINSYKQTLKNTMDKNEKKQTWEELIKLFVIIKDFYCAVKTTEAYLKQFESRKYEDVLQNLKIIQEYQMTAYHRIHKNNVVMFCFDALRERDLKEGLMPKLHTNIYNDMYVFEKAYSVSTSTFESLIPAYSLNRDMSTKYYKSTVIQEEDCPFIQEAVRQNRKIYFYTDAIPFVNSNNIHVCNISQTASEKMWQFAIDASDEDNGLFYVHILYESHFSYPNPYTDSNLEASGTSIFFDYLEKNGGKLKTDYVKQHEDALRYLDDIVAPKLAEIRAEMILFADHGIAIPKKEQKLQEISYPMLTFGNDLIKVPMAIKSRNISIAQNKNLMSLFEINNIVISLLKGDKYKIPYFNHVKVQRSDIYNPDFKYIYRQLGYQQGLVSFEMFVFETGHKLVIYRDGVMELYNENDEIIYNNETKKELYKQIENEVTVLEVE